MQIEGATELLKYLSSAIAVLIPLLKSFSTSTGRRRKELQERHERLLQFFHEGGTERHPLLVETSFAAAVGHTKLSSVEIPILLRQQNPSQFIETYVQAKDYLEPNKDGTKLELRSLARLTWLRRTLVGSGIFLYLILMLAAFGLTLLHTPKLALAGDWANLLLNLGNALLFAGTGAYCLLGVSKLHRAAKLQSSQSDT